MEVLCKNLILDKNEYQNWTRCSEKPPVTRYFFKALLDVINIAKATKTADFMLVGKTKRVYLRLGTL